LKKLIWLLKKLSHNNN